MVVPKMIIDILVHLELEDNCTVLEDKNKISFEIDM